MFATFHITFGEPTRSISVPANAVVHRGPEASVWVVLDGNRFMLRGIATGMLVGDMLQVTDGLQEGERVVTHGALFIDRAGRID
jgi:cobalt-zinc-cadmium efflux system membrane fusion protein